MLLVDSLSDNHLLLKSDPKFVKMAKEQYQDPTSQVSNASPLQSNMILDDPHRAALEENNKHRLPAKTWAAVFFLGFTFQPALSFSILGIFPIVNVISMDVANTAENSSWMSSGWTLAGTIAFSIAGRLSDILGRRYVLSFGQLTLIVSYVLPWPILAVR